MSPRDKYDECDVLVQTGFHCLISSFSVSLSFSVFFVKTTVSFPFLGSFHLEFQNTQLCSLLIPLSVFSGSLCSSFLAARSTRSFHLSTRLLKKLTIEITTETFTQPPNQNQEIFVSRGNYYWDIIYMKTTMPLDSLTYTNSIFIASITTDLCKIQVTCNMKT